MPQLIGMNSPLRVARNIGKKTVLGKSQMTLSTVSSHCYYRTTCFQTLCAVGIFQSYESEDEGVSAVGSGTSISQSGDGPPISSRHYRVETSEEHIEPEFKHLNQNNPSPPTALPPRKRKGFRYFFLKKIPAIFGRKRKQ